MKMKKLTALLSAAVMMLGLTPMALAENDWYTYDDATKTYTLTETVVPGDIKVKEAGADESDYDDEVTVKFTSNQRTFDFKASLDMTPVQEKFTTALKFAKQLGKYDGNLSEREVEGEFTVTVKPGDYITIPDADIDGSAMSGFDTTSTIYEEVSRDEDADGNLVIKVKLKADTTVADLEADGLGEIAYTSEDVAVTKSGSSIKIKGTVSGYIQTVDLVGDTDYNAKASFVAKENDSATIYATIKSKSSSSGLSGGGSTSTTKKAEVTILDGTEEVYNDEFTLTNGSYVFDFSTVAVPETDENKVFNGWYEDAACTIPADSKETITKDTTYYVGWLDTKYDINFNIDGKNASVNTGVTGSVNVGSDDLVVGEDGVEVKIGDIDANGVKIIGWYLDAECTIPADASVVITEDTTFYATTKEIGVPGVLNGGDHYAYIIGYPEGDVRPENSITREEVATIFFRLLTDEARTANYAATNQFTDVEEGRWSNVAISTMANMGIVTGYYDGTFKPNKAITRAEFATIAARFDDGEAQHADFIDMEGHWADGYVGKAAGLQWINGYSDGTFKPDNNITRAEVMAIVNRMLKRAVAADYILDGAVRWSDNSESKWYYLDVIEATNSHAYERLAEGQTEERWTELLQNRDWSELEN